MFRMRERGVRVGAIALLLVGSVVPSLSAQDTSGDSTPISTPSDSNPSMLLQQIRQEFSARRGFGGSRGDVCWVSPVPGEPGLLWSDRPLLVWQVRTPEGITIDHLFLTVVNFDSRETVWSQELPPDSQSIIYGGQGLEPGQNYAVSLSSRTDTNPDRYLFQMVESAQRQQITAQLQTLDQQLQARQASAEAIAIQQAHYLLEQGLASDAFQLLYTVEHPSAELTQTLQTFISQQCPDR